MCFFVDLMSGCDISPSPTREVKMVRIIEEMCACVCVRGRMMTKLYSRQSKSPNFIFSF